MGIGLIGTYPPRMCGLATVASHLRRALIAAGEPCVPVAAMVKDPSDAAYGPEVLVPIRHHEQQDYVAAAHALNAAPIEAVILEHEFGIFGGHLGSHIDQLLAPLRKPVITVFHTVVDEPSPAFLSALGSVAARSARVVALSHRDRNLLCSRYRLPADRVDMIPLGVPEPPAGTPEEWKGRLGLSGRTVAMTFGLLGPGKGIETAIEAVGRVARSHPDLLYLVVGATHPDAKRVAGESYRGRLVTRVGELGIANQVQFIDRYLSEEELLQYLLASDIYVTPYPQKGRGVSLTTLYAAHLGKAMLTTPFDYAQELLANGASWMVPFQDVHAMSQALQVLISNPEGRRSLGDAARDRTRDFAWSDIAHRYLDLARTLATEAPPPILIAPEVRPALNAALHSDRLVIRTRARQPTALGLALHNTGSEYWAPHDQEIAIAGDLLSARRSLLGQEFLRQPIATAPLPGGAVEMRLRFLAPARPGMYVLELYLVHPGAGRFGTPLLIRLAVEPPRSAIFSDARFPARWRLRGGSTPGSRWWI